MNYLLFKNKNKFYLLKNDMNYEFCVWGYDVNELLYKHDLEHISFINPEEFLEEEPELLNTLETPEDIKFLFPEHFL